MGKSIKSFILQVNSGIKVKMGEMYLYFEELWLNICWVPGIIPV